MTEQELREKIIKALKRGGNMFHEYFMRSLNDAKESGKTHFGSKDCDKSMYDFFADALIEAGLKFDVNYSFTAAFNSLQEEREKELERRLAKAEHRAEVAERALLTVCTNIVTDEEDDLAVEPRARVLYKAYLKQAEKEFAEENGGKKKV